MIGKLITYTLIRGDKQEKQAIIEDKIRVYDREESSSVHTILIDKYLISNCEDGSIDIINPSTITKVHI